MTTYLITFMEINYLIKQNLLLENILLQRHLCKLPVICKYRIINAKVVNMTVKSIQISKH